MTVWRAKPAYGLSFLAFLGFAAVLLGPNAVSAQTIDLVDRSALRVCADPANMPFSNDKGEGFENRLAELIADKLSVPLLYTWFPQATGFIRNTLRARKCDLVMGYAEGHELVQNTSPYFQSAYVLVFRADSELSGVESLDDPRLKDARIGVIAGTPPATIMALNGLIGNAKSYPLLVDRRFSSPAEDMIREIVAGDLDGGVLWGPIGGYYAKRTDAVLVVVPLTKETKGPGMVFRITMGIRANEPEWEHQLNRLIADNLDEINAILLDFGVPILDEDGTLIVK